MLRKVFASGTDFSHGNVTLSLSDDADVKAFYERMLRVNVEGAEGSDFYPYGSTVTIRAIEKDKIQLLVREAFDHWEGLPYGSKDVTFTVTDDIDAKAVYRDDYTGLMLIVAGTSTFILYKIILGKGISITWMFIKMKEKASELLQKLIKHNQVNLS